MNDIPIRPHRTAGSAPSEVVLEAIVADGRRRRRQFATWTSSAVAATAVAAVAVGVGDGLNGPTTSSHRLGAPTGSAGTCAAEPPPTPLPGSTPAYTVNSAHDWFFSRQQSEQFFQAYQQPSPRPEDTVPSPQPSGPLTEQLVRVLEAAGVPGATQLDRDEADSGRRGTIRLQGRLADGSDLVVHRTRTQHPFTISGYYGSDTEDSSKDVVIEEVPGTACVALRLRPDATKDRGAVVQVVTPDGVTTGWSSVKVPLDQLRTWAYSAARWETEHPAG